MPRFRVTLELDVEAANPALAQRLVDHLKVRAALLDNLVCWGSRATIEDHATPQLRLLEGFPPELGLVAPIRAPVPEGSRIFQVILRPPTQEITLEHVRWLKAMSLYRAAEIARDKGWEVLRIYQTDMDPEETDLDLDN